MDAISYMLCQREGMSSRASLEAVGAAKVLKLAIRLREFSEEVREKGELRPDAAHMGVCTRRKADGTRCPTIQKVADRLAAEGVVLVDPGHPLAANRTVTLADAASCPLLLREPGSAGREIVESLFLSGGIQIAPAWESVSTLALIRAAQNGLGIAILPELLVRDALKSGDLVSLPLPPDILTRSLYLIRHRNKYLSSSAEEFQNLCRMWKF